MNRKVKNLALGLATLLPMMSMGATVAETGLPFQDHNLPLEKRLDDLMNRLTLEEKIDHLGPNPKGVERLGIKPYFHWNHAPHGINNTMGYPDSLSVVYPTPINQSATFDPELMVRMGQAVGEEGRAKYHARPQMLGGLCFWNPTVNLARDPRWGRTNEAYGEDPYLSGTLASYYIRGLQGKHPRYFLAIGMPKHFVANNYETTRLHGNSVVPMRALREYYMRPFEICVKEGKAFSLMSAYNRLNGVPCVTNRWLLHDVLRKEWGFKGYTVSDFGSVMNAMSRHHVAKTPEEAAAMSIRAGIDVSSGGGFACMGKALKQGLVSMQDIDRAVRNQFRSRFLLGEFDPQDLVPFSKVGKDVIACEKHREVSRQIARESVVLMKNQGQLLPWDSSKIKKLAVIGRNADNFEFGSYSNQPINTVNPLTILEGLRRFWGKHVDINYALGCDIPLINQENDVWEPVDADVASFKGVPGWQGEYFSNEKLEGAPTVVRMDPAIQFDWKSGSPHPSIPKDNFSVRWTADVVPAVSRVVRFNLHTTESMRFMVNGDVLAKSIRRRFKDYADMTLQAGKSYRMVLEFTSRRGVAMAKLDWNVASASEQAREKAKAKKVAQDDENAIRKAVKLAKESDAVVLVVGTTDYVEGEAMDRNTIELPGRQNELVERVCAVNPNTVVVLVNGSSVALDRIKRVAPAIVETFFMGPDLGQVVSEVLMGKVNPSGKLPLTFYKSDAQLPPMDDYNIIGHGRTYQYFEGEVTYPFGHGLSYTRFAYDGLKLDRRDIARDGTVSVNFTVTNTGDRAGDEVSQLYLRVLDAEVKMPLKKLVGFKRISLKPGESKDVTLKVSAQDAAYWDVAANGWHVPTGRIEVQVGSSSQDIRLRKTLTIK